MSDAVLDNIALMPVNGNRLELPKDIVFDNYPAVKKMLVKAGGKYNKNGFIFKSDAFEFKARLVGGETIDNKKRYQEFFTPAGIGQYVVDLACILPHHRCLEPSAGRGALAVKMHKESEKLTTVELQAEHADYLRCNGFPTTICADFLQLHKEDIGEFDRIVANPPFNKNQDIDHVQHMYKFLCEGGKLVSITSPSWYHGSQKKQVEFKEWLRSVSAEVNTVAPGTFKESGTQVGTMIIEIWKKGTEHHV